MTRFFAHAFGPFFKGFARNPMRSIGTIGLLSVLFFVMFLLLLFQSLVQESVNTAEKKIDLVFFLEPDAPESKIHLLQSYLEELDKNEKIESFTYISKVEALQNFAEKYPETFSFRKRNNLENPLSPSFEVVPKGNNFTIVTDIFASDTFSGILNISQMERTIENRARSQKMLDFLFFIKQGITLIIGAILLSIAGVTAAFISSSFVLRQKEIFIMRLVGASYSFIRRPFLVEGVLFAGISFGIGVDSVFLFSELCPAKNVWHFWNPRRSPGNN